MRLQNIIISILFFSPLFVSAQTILGVQRGGTGATSFTVGECLKGNGTSAITTGTCGGGSGNSFGQSWELYGGGMYLSPTTTKGIIVSASSTISGLTVVNATTTNGTTTYQTVHQVFADASDGILFSANNGTNVGILGAGNSANTLFYGGVNIDGATRLATSLTGIIKATAGVISTATNGTDYTLIIDKDCTGIGHLVSVVSNGTFTCSADSGGSVSVPNLVYQTIGGLKYYNASSSATDNLRWYFTNGFVSNASSTINGNLNINGNSTTTNATTTNLYNSGDFWLNNERFTDLTGTGLSNSNGVLTNSGVISNSCGSGITCSGTNPSSFSISSNALTLAMLPQIGANSVLGNLTGSSANVTEIATSSLFKNSSGSVTGLLSSTDWTTFNNKLSVESDPIVKAINGIVKSNGVTISSATNGTDYTLITGLTCSGSDKISAVTADGTFTCSTDQSGGSSAPNLIYRTIGALKYYTASSSQTDNLSFHFNNGFLSIASSTINAGLTILNSTTTNATTTSLAIGGIGSCSSSQALKTDSNGLVTCQTVSASASPAGSDTQLQFNDGGSLGGTGGLVYQKTTGKLMFGGGQSVSDQWKYAFHISTTTDLQFEVASSTGDLLEVTSTSTDYRGGIDLYGGTRVTVGTSTKNIPQDTFVVDGRINTLDWDYFQCTASHAFANRTPATSQVTDANDTVLSATTGTMCGDFAFDESPNGQMNAVVGQGQGYLRVQPGATGAGGATVARDGAGYRFNSNYLSSATNTPVMEVRMRMEAMQNASSSITTLGFGNLTTAGAGTADFSTYATRGCWVTASTTQANWIAVCTNGSNATTTVNTGVASSSVFTGTPNGMQDFRLEMSSTTFNVYIRSATSPQASSSNPVAIIRTNIPNTTTLTPFIGTGSWMARAAANFASPIHINRIRLWVKNPLW